MHRKREVFADRLAAPANTSRQRWPVAPGITQAMGHFRAVLNYNLNWIGHKLGLKKGKAEWPG